MKRTDWDEAAEAKAEESSGDIPMPEVADIVWEEEVKRLLISRKPYTGLELLQVNVVIIKG